MQDRLGQADPALETLGQGIDGLFQDRLQMHIVDDIVQALLAMGALHAAHVGDEVQKSYGCHVRIGRRPLGQIADLGLGGDGFFVHLMTHHPDPSRRRRHETGDHFHGGGFAGAIGP